MVSAGGSSRANRVMGSTPRGVPGSVVRIARVVRSRAGPEAPGAADGDRVGSLEAGKATVILEDGTGTASTPLLSFDAFIVTAVAWTLIDIMAPIPDIPTTPPPRR